MYVCIYIYMYVCIYIYVCIACIVYIYIHSHILSCVERESKKYQTYIYIYMYIPNIAMGNGPFIDIHRWFTWVYLLKMVDLSMAMLVITRWYICLLQKIYTVPPILMIKKILDIMFSMKVATM